MLIQPWLPVRHESDDRAGVLEHEDETTKPDFPSFVEEHVADCRL